MDGIGLMHLDFTEPRRVTFNFFSPGKYHARKWQQRRTMKRNLFRPINPLTCKMAHELLEFPTTRWNRERFFSTMLKNFEFQWRRLSLDYVCVENSTRAEIFFHTLDITINVLKRYNLDTFVRT